MIILIHTMYCWLNIAVLLMTASVLQGHVYQKSNANVSSFTGKLINLRELNVNYNKLLSIPPELGDCENLERLEMTANRNLTELPFEVRQDDQHIQYSYAHFNTHVCRCYSFSSWEISKDWRTWTWRRISLPVFLSVCFAWRAWSVWTSATTDSKTCRRIWTGVCFIGRGLSGSVPGWETPVKTVRRGGGLTLWWAWMKFIQKMLFELRFFVLFPVKISQNS